MFLNPGYQNATLCPETSGQWRICWYNTHPQTNRLTRIRKTFDLNRVRYLPDREAIAKILVSNINMALKNGYNYFVDTQQIEIPEGFVLHGRETKKAQKPVQVEMSISNALDKAVKKRTLGMAARTADSYLSFVRTFTIWLEKNKLDKLPVGSFTADHFNDFMVYKSELGHGNRNINDYVNFFKTTFETIRKMKLIKENPIVDVDFLPERESQRFTPFTKEELQIIGPALDKHNPRFYLFTRFIALEFMRPYHISRLQVKNFLFDQDLIALDPETTKNKKVVRKQLLKPIKTMMLKMGYDKLPPDHYIFGKDFMPSPTLFPSLSNRAAEIWKKVVIEGLGINKKMYALKHTASQYFVNANENADLKYLQQQMEHHSMAQTEIYLQGKVTKRIDEDKVNTLDY